MSSQLGSNMMEFKLGFHLHKPQVGVLGQKGGRARRTADNEGSIVEVACHSVTLPGKVTGLLQRHCVSESLMCAANATLCPCLDITFFFT